MRKYSYDRVLRDLPPDILRLVGSIREANVKETFRREAYPREYEGILELAKLASVKFSNQIEDIVSTDERIYELVIRGGRPLTHTDEEIAGYGDALDVIHTERPSLTKGTMHRLHALIHAGMPEDRGHFKSHDNAVVEIDRDGNKRVILRTVPHAEVDRNIDAMLDAYLVAETEGIEPLLLIPCLIVDYLCIHPYPDGNGRTSRLLTYMLLYQHGFDVCRYVSLDEHIAATKGSYYRTLSESSQGWDAGRNDYIPFVRYFLRTMFECYTDLDTRFAMKGASAMRKNERVELILRNSLVPISKRQIQMALPDVSIHTVEAVIKRMVAEGRAERVGGFRDARYRYLETTDNKSL